MPQIHEQMIHPSRIEVNPNNPRHEAGDVTELAKSIKENGQLTAVRVRPHPTKGGYFLLEDGERRMAAMRSWADMIRCEVDVIPEGQNPLERDLIVALSTTGKPLNAIERARAYGRMKRELRLNAAQIARKLGVHPTVITKSLELLELAPKTQDAVIEGKLTVTQAHTLATDFRKKQQKKSGGRALGAPQYEPDFFNRFHACARRAETLCDNEESHHAVRYGREGGFNGACHRHWDQAIRLDEGRILRLNAEQNGLRVTVQSEGYDGPRPDMSVPFKPSQGS